MRVIVAIAVLALAGALLGCAASSSAAQEAVETNIVQMPASYRFDPPLIRVKAGTTVTWKNGDNFTHDVHLMGKINWESAPLKPGESASYIFSEPGEYAYLCDFHSQDMKGRVIVTQ